MSFRWTAEGEGSLRVFYLTVSRAFLLLCTAIHSCVSFNFQRDRELLFLDVLCERQWACDTRSKIASRQIREIPVTHNHKVIDFGGLVLFRDQCEIYIYIY